MAAPSANDLFMNVWVSKINSEEFPMPGDPEWDLLASQIEVRLALGGFTVRERLKLLWFLLLGTVVTVKGSAVLSVKTFPLEER